MVAEKCALRLSAEDRDQLERLIRSGQRSARVINRARIPLKTDVGLLYLGAALGIWGARSFVLLPSLKALRWRRWSPAGRLIEGLAAGHGGGTSGHSAKIGGYNETVESKNGFRLYGR